MSIKQPGFTDYALLLALAAVYGGNFLLIKIGVATLPAPAFAVLRLAAASAAVWVLAVRAGESFRVPRRLWWPLVVAGLTGNTVPYILIGWGQQRVDAGIAAICMGVMPLTTLLLAHIFTHDEKLTPRKGLGVVLGLAGLVVLIGWDKLTTLGEQTMRELSLAAGACIYGVNALVTRSLTGQPRLALVAIMLVVSTVLSIPVALYANPGLDYHPSLDSIVATIMLGALPTGIGTIVMFGMVQKLGASFFSQINFLVPVFGVLWGTWLLGERPPLSAIAALGLILLGVALARGTRPVTRPVAAPDEARP